MAGRLSSEKRLWVVLDIPPIKGRIYIVCIPDQASRDAFSRMCDGRDDILVHSYPEGIPEDIWKATDVVYAPSLYEGCSLLWMEAAARGVPSVATLVGHLPQIAAEDPSVMPMMLDPADLGNAGEKIAAVLAEPERWRAKARALAERYHDIRKQGECIEAILMDLVT
jgi:glycosyltransferase involved in cell wall biosynthesis